jgi:hypothetical protein
LTLLALNRYCGIIDRGAYVNFLEVQLERVSAACLSVQAHDQRFHDMHEVIGLMEDKVATSMRLVGLAQQCTEVSLLNVLPNLSQF